MGTTKKKRAAVLTERLPGSLRSSLEAHGPSIDKTIALASIAEALSALDPARADYRTWRRRVGAYFARACKMGAFDKNRARLSVKRFIEFVLTNCPQLNELLDSPPRRRGRLVQARTGRDASGATVAARADVYAAPKSMDEALATISEQAARIGQLEAENSTLRRKVDAFEDQRRRQVFGLNRGAGLNVPSGPLPGPPGLGDLAASLLAPRDEANS